MQHDPWYEEDRRKFKARQRIKEQRELAARKKTVAQEFCMAHGIDPQKLFAHGNTGYALMVPWEEE